METNFIVAIFIFLAAIFTFWKLTNKAYKKEYGMRMRKLWGVNMYYWHDAIIVSTGVTALVLVLLRWGNVLTF